jgi:hypothetical protein
MAVDITLQPLLLGLATLRPRTHDLFYTICCYSSNNRFIFMVEVSPVAERVRHDLSDAALEKVTERFNGFPFLASHHPGHPTVGLRP